jgi:hypothetical protein
MKTIIEKGQFLNHKIITLTIPLITILLLSFSSGFFEIDSKIIHREQLWDLLGRPYIESLKELNLPKSERAVFITGNPNKIKKIERYWKKAELGHIFSCQILSLLPGIKITPTTIAFLINFLFGIFAILFSLLTGYFIFKNGYSSILIFALIIIFRNNCQGLIYGIPYKYSYPVFNPLAFFCIFIFIIIFLGNQTKRYWMCLIFILSGFVTAYIGHIRSSEIQIAVAALIGLILLMLIEYYRINGKKSFNKIIFKFLIALMFIYAGFFAYQKMIDAFEIHRDNKYNFPPNEEEILSRHPFYHVAFFSMFRYPNKFNYLFKDMTSVMAVYKKYPELEKKYSTDYFHLQNSKDYNEAMQNVYLEFVANNPQYVQYYIIRSIYDYFLFLPYYTWTGEKSAHQVMPKINDYAEIEPEDIAPDFRTTPGEWLLNLKLKYLPKKISFWVYFILSYAILLNAIYFSIKEMIRPKHRQGDSDRGYAERISIYLLWGMLIYFFFASLVRTLIPMYGHSAAVAFNIIIIYNLIRIISTRSIKIKRTNIPLCLVLLVVLIPVVTMASIQQWLKLQIVLTPVKSSLSIASDEIYDKILRVKGRDKGFGAALLEIPTAIGEEYIVSVFFKRGTAEAGQIRVGTYDNVADLYWSRYIRNLDWMEFGGKFKAEWDVMYVNLEVISSKEGLDCFFDNLIVRNLTTGEIILNLHFNEEKLSMPR